MKSVKSAQNTGPKSSKSKKPQINNFGILSKEDHVTTIYVGNMKFSKDEFAIKKMFSKYGKVTYVRLVRDSNTLVSKGFAFIQMPNQLDATRAIDKLNGMIVDDRTLKVSIAVDNGKKKAKELEKEVITASGESLGNKAPEAAKSIPKRKRVRGLDLLFQNTKK